MARPLIIAAAVAVLAMPAAAGNSWLSRVHNSGLQGQQNLSAVGGLLPGAAAAARSTSTTAVFDIVISVQDNPQGDDDASVDAANDAAQNAYENRIKKFADAVFQATNGAHQIGRVSIYRDYKQRSLADVQWETNCGGSNGPWAYAGGFQKSGKYIHFCTNWSGSSTMSSPKGSGYTLAHEWGHYAYNIYDEYAANQCQVNLGTMFGLLCPAWQPRSSDTVSDTIMHNQWYAASGTVRAGYGGVSGDYLEYSTSDHTPFKGAGSNGQKRYFGESGWETLTRSTATDPRWPGLNRTRYSNLTKPTSPNFRVRGSVVGAQSALDIRWVGNQVVELMIDRSGSMGGSRIANAKTGAGLLIAQLPEGQAAVGVGSFNNATSQNYTITDIPNPDAGVRAAATAAVNGLSAGGLTALYDGLMLALAEINTFQTTTGTTREGVVYVLSDGGDNSSSATEASVIAAYQAAGVPIISFAYGGGAPTGTLGRMATATGGLFLTSPTTVSAIQAALLSANAATSDSVILGTASAPVAAGATFNETIPIDSTLASVLVNINYTGAQANTTLSILDPSGANTGAVFTCTGTVSCSTTLDSAMLATGGVGNYTVRTVNNTASSIDISGIASGNPVAGGGYNVSVAIDGGTTVTYPAGMIISATVTNNLPLSGLTVEAIVDDPLGVKTTVALVDDGTGSDAIADDGVYTGSFHYTSNGVHTVTVTASNDKGTGQTTPGGLSIAVAQDGSVTLPVPTSVGENFVRSATVTATATGVAADDHTNDPTVPAACTAVANDNIDTNGRVDFAGDVDCFFFTPSSTANDLVARVTGLSGGMSPTITVYDAIGTTQLLQVNLAGSENSVVGTVATVPAAALNAAGHVVTVQHGDATATAGGYAVSIGAALVSDVPAADAAPIPVVTPSGGGIGLWTLLVLSLLALVGLRQRRRMP